MELKFIKEVDFEEIGMEFDHAFWSCLVGWNRNEIVKGKVSKNQNEPKPKKRETKTEKAEPKIENVLVSISTEKTEPSLILVSISTGKNRTKNRKPKTVQFWIQFPSRQEKT